MILKLLMLAAGEILQLAEPFLEQSLHPTVIIRGYVQALEDAVSIIDELAFNIDTSKREEMLKIVSSCIGTKFASRFGNLLPVSPALPGTDPLLMLKYHSEK